MGRDHPLQLLEIDAICDRFEEAWQNHGWPRFDEYVNEVKADLRPELLFELLRIDVTYRRNLGHSPAGTDYERWFPGHEETIRDAISAATSDQLRTDESKDPYFESSASISTLPHDAAGIPQPLVVGPGSIFGDYRILGRLGRGGMGVVYRARQNKLSRDVALKMIGTGAYARAEEIARFWAEAEAAARLQHPHIVGIHEIGEIDGQHYFSMDIVEGMSLTDCMNGQPLAPRDAARFLKQAAEAISYAHSRGVLHRDLKPSNMLIDANDQVRITDFGLAKRVDGGAKLTVDSQVLGTPSYMPPEQALGDTKDVDETADVYSLGATLYELLTGRPPFRANTVHETLNQVISQIPAKPRNLNSSVPQDLENVCLKCLEKEQKGRYASASELVDELGRYLRGEPVRARPISYTASAWRWCRRNPLVSTLGAALAIAVAIGVPALISYQFAATKNSLMQANATEITELIQELSEDKRLRQFGLADLRRTLMESTEPYLNKIVSASIDTEQARISKVKAYSLLAYMESEIGNEWMAMKQQESAVALAKELCSDYPTKTDHLLFLAEQYHALGYHSRYLDPALAIACTQESTIILESLEDEMRSEGKYWFRWAAGHHNLAVMMLEKYHIAAAEEHFRKAVEGFGKVKSDADVVEFLVHLSLDQIDLQKNQRLFDSNHAAALKAGGRFDEAEQQLRAALADPLASDPSFHSQFTTALCLRTLGELQEKFGKPEEARRSYEASIEIFEKLGAEYPLERESWVKSCYFLLWKTEFHIRLGTFDDAKKALEVARKRFDEMGGELDEFTQKLHIREAMRQTEFLLAAKFESLGRAAAAFQNLDMNPEYGAYQTSRQATFHYEMAGAYRRANRPANEMEMLVKSEQRWLHAIASVDARIPDFEFGLSKTRRQLGICHVEIGEIEKGRRYLQLALKQQQSLCEGSPQVVTYAQERELTREAIDRAAMAN